MSRWTPGLAVRRAIQSKQSGLIVGITVVVLFVGSVVFALNATYGLPLVDRKTVTAQFDTVSGLMEGDDVRVASSRVGYVSEIRLQDGRATAVLEIADPNFQVYRDATATTASVGARSALGQKFVDLDPGDPASGELPPDAIVPQRETRGAQEISDLFNVFDEPTRVAAGSTLREFGGGFAGRSEDLHDAIAAAPGMLPDLGTVSRSLAADDGADLVALLRSSDTLAARFEGRQQELADMTRQLAGTLDALAVDDGAAARQSVQRSPETLRELRLALDALHAPLADLEVSMRESRAGAAGLGEATPDLRGVLREGVAPLDKMPAVAEDAEPAVESLTEVMADARPLSPRLVDLGEGSASVLGDLAPYSSEMSTFFGNAASALSQGDAAGNWLRIYLVPRTESLSGTAPVEDPGVSRNAYPEPGEVQDDSAPALMPEGRR